MADAVAGVRCAHQICWHNDLKPGNFVKVGSTLKLADFGVARALGDDATHDVVDHVSEHYAAPERLAEGIVSAAGDVYSLGLIYAEIRTGTQPSYGHLRQRIPDEAEQAIVDACIKHERSARLSLAELSGFFPLPSSGVVPAYVRGPDPGETRTARPLEPTVLHTNRNRGSHTVREQNSPRSRLRLIGTVGGAVVAVLTLALILTVGPLSVVGNHKNQEVETTTTTTNTTTTTAGPTNLLDSTKNLVSAKSNVTEASTGTPVVLAGRSFGSAIYSTVPTTGPTLVDCPVDGTTSGSCPWVTFHLDGHYETFDAWGGITAGSGVDCAVEVLGQVDGKPAPVDAKFGSAATGGDLTLSVAGAQYLTLSWTPYSSSGGSCGFGLGNPIAESMGRLPSVGSDAQTTRSTTLPSTAVVSQPKPALEWASRPNATQCSNMYVPGAGPVIVETITLTNEGLTPLDITAGPTGHLRLLLHYDHGPTGSFNLPTGGSTIPVTTSDIGQAYSIPPNTSSWRYANDSNDCYLTTWTARSLAAGASYTGELAFPFANGTIDGIEMAYLSGTAGLGSVLSLTEPAH